MKRRIFCTWMRSTTSAHCCAHQTSRMEVQENPSPLCLTVVTMPPPTLPRSTMSFHIPLSRYIVLGKGCHNETGTFLDFFLWNHYLLRIESKKFKFLLITFWVKCHSLVFLFKAFLIDYVYLQSFLEGYNSTMLAYGQTGSGKSFTMQEDPDHIGTLVMNLNNYIYCAVFIIIYWYCLLTIDTCVHTIIYCYNFPGLIPRSIVHVFEGKEAEEDEDTIFDVRVSYIEIYNEEIRDPLGEDPTQKLEIKVNCHKVQVQKHYTFLARQGRRSCSAHGGEYRHVCTVATPRDCKQVGKTNLSDLFSIICPE